MLKISVNREYAAEVDPNFKTITQKSDFLTLK